MSSVRCFEGACLCKSVKSMCKCNYIGLLLISSCYFAKKRAVLHSCGRCFLPTVIHAQFWSALHKNILHNALWLQGHHVWRLFENGSRFRRAKVSKPEPFALLQALYISFLGPLHISNTEFLCSYIKPCPVCDGSAAAVACCQLFRLHLRWNKLLCCILSIQAKTTTYLWQE